MTGTKQVDRQGAVAILVIDAPPVNALGVAVRAGLAEGLSAALDDSAIGAIVLRAEGRIFSAGADIREFGKHAPAGVPPLPTLCNLIEMSPKPVIAAVQGAALGGGMELVLAAHVRLAGPEARFGLPEVALGLMPGAGGTQRTPRLIGAEAALRLMLTGRPVNAEQAQAMGLVDAVLPEALVESAVVLAAEMAAEGRPPRPTRERREGLADFTAYQAAIVASRNQTSGRLPAPGRIVDCVEAAMLLPFDQGLAFERAAFEELVAGPESAGLRSAFLAERRASSFAEARAATRPVERVGIVGLGPAGVQLAAAATTQGLAVTVLEADEASLAAGLGRLADLQESAVAVGEMRASARDAAWNRLIPGTDPLTLGLCDLVVDCTPEVDAAKPETLARMGRVLKAGAVVASVVTWADPAELARVSGHAGQVMGLSLGRPGRWSRLAEIAVPDGTAPDAVATLAALMRKLERLVVRTGAVGRGGIGVRVAAALKGAGDLLLETGASPLQVDQALRSFGFAKGPYEAADVEGLELDWAERQRRVAMGEPVVEGSDLADLLVEAGRLGWETGRGYYRHDGGVSNEDPEVEQLLGALREAKGIARRPVGRDEIILCCLSAAANEGARALGESAAHRPGDVDAALVAGFDFPRWEGGPMAWAAARGLIVLRADLRRFASGAPRFWQVAPLIDSLIRDGRGLADLDQR
jgi:3-hydroxyacyl-CoA dehydrogenase